MNTETEEKEVKLATHSEIIDYVVEYYKTHKRCKDENGFCVYENNAGDRCGHSICLEEGFDRGLLNDVNSNSVIEDYGDEVHLPQFRGKSPYFWGRVQTLHDSDYHWVANERGGFDLTQEGVDYVEKTKTLYKDV